MHSAEFNVFRLLCSNSTYPRWHLDRRAARAERHIDGLCSRWDQLPYPTGAAFDDHQDMLNTTTKVRDVMTSPAITVRVNTSSAHVIDTLLRNDISGVPVVDEDCRLVGIVSEADLVLSAAYGKGNRRALALVAEVIQGHPAGWVDRVNAQTAESLMTRDVATVAPDDDIAEASRRMLRRRCSRLPVIESGKVVGVVSRHDVVRALFSQNEGAVHGPADVPRNGFGDQA
jgi:CBS domain-containing protein